MANKKSVQGWGLGTKAGAGAGSGAGAGDGIGTGATSGDFGVGGNRITASGNGMSALQLEQYARQMQRRQTSYGRARGQL